LVLVLAAFFFAGSFWVEGLLSRVATPSLVAGDGPQTVLIVGSDSRANIPDDLEGKFGSFAGQRSDVIILAHVVDGRLQLLSLPRDLRVSIPGKGTDKINAAYAYGGGDLLIDTIQSDLGIPISHYMEVEFGGFAEIVDAVGGVELTFKRPTRDLKTGLDVKAGAQVVDGATALAYVRSRHTEEKKDGEWVSANSGDIARTARQREVLTAVIAKATSPGGIFKAPTLASAIGSSLQVDSGLHAWTMARLAWAFKSASETESISLPVAGKTIDGISYVVAVDPASAVIDAFVAGDPLPGTG
jgi:LCP family protein required for cell wall assembly